MERSGACKRRIENRVASSEGRTPPASRLLLQPRLRLLDGGGLDDGGVRPHSVAGHHQ